MMVRVGAAQLGGQLDLEANLRVAEGLVRQAAADGAQIVCLPELFHRIYFCVEERPEYFDWAEPLEGPTVTRMAALARELELVLIAPVYERAPEGLFNSAVVLGPSGDVLGRYRKTHIPFMDRALSAEPRGNEQFFFQPGNLGFPVFDTPFGVRVGVLICYDRHYPEAARVLALKGAQVLFVPTATSGMTRYLWDLELRAHAVTNGYFVCGVNRVGVDVGGSSRNHFGSSLIANPRGEVLAQAGDQGPEVVCADLDLDQIDRVRALWGNFQNRRPEIYGELLTLRSPEPALAGQSA